jgi:hypothetical protein
MNEIRAGRDQSEGIRLLRDCENTLGEQRSGVVAELVGREPKLGLEAEIGGRGSGAI